MSSLLDNINKPNDIKKIDRKDYKTLAKEIRRFLVNNVSKTGGHLASNLGAVELTMALHLALDLPKDKIVWDVGHQSYTHKILTGRKDDFIYLRKYNGLSGFPKRNESDCDVFDTGHSSTSISAAMGLAFADKLNEMDSTIVAVIGDGALTGGMAYEALNNLSALKRNFIIILNDNNMSISENVGGMSEHLSKFRVGEKYNDLKNEVEQSLNKIPMVGSKIAKGIKRTKDSIKQLFVPDGIFNELGITYIGPIDGHDTEVMVELFNHAKKIDHPVLIHLKTKKGYGYKFAMEDPAKFHGIDAFDKKTGKKRVESDKDSYTSVFSKKLVEMAEQDEEIVAITAAMPDGTGLSRFKDNYPDRFFDVGIAEEHAVTFAAGLAAGGKKPYISIYSSFYQRAYDQILHDVCIQNLSVRLIIDRAGLVGRDGETHQGIFDIAFLSSIPNLTILSPMCAEELREALEFSKDFDGPIAIRFSRGEAFEYDEYESNLENITKSNVIVEGNKLAIISLGSLVEEVIESAKLLNDNNIFPTVVNARCLKPIDKDMIDSICQSHSHILIAEEGIKRGGYAEAVFNYIYEKGYNVKCDIIAIDDKFVKQGSVPHLRRKLGLDKIGIMNRAVELLND
ncbi:MAG: 1-deoxy-D-xylulose-5-phosphate synthase [Lachnospiraceae bacterium]|nr:1-deoxy-D-xylulose-5-phosphate synthase [Lachnospiraceae bacterium]